MAKDDKLTRDERPTTKEEKLKALDAAISHIEKQYGKGSVMKLGDNSAHMNVEAVPTGSLSLDLALGIGGLPKGRIIEIYGPESSGKTTVTLHMIAEVQKRGGIAGFIDAEHALDPVYAKNIGVDIDNLYISQPDNGEQALEITETMVRSGAIDIIVVDSVAALVPKAEIDGDMGDSHVGLQARLMSQALRKLTGAVGKTNTIVIFINQLREKVGVIYGNPEENVPGCIANGIDEQTAGQIYDMMMDFAKYAFNKSHAACYAVVAYQTAYLKYYYPVEFMAALMTSVIDNPKKVSEYILNCRNMDIAILPPDVNAGEAGFSVSDGKIRYALTAIKRVGRPIIDSLVQERKERGPFTNLKDFITRMSDKKEMNKRAIENLIKAGALDGLGGTRKQFMSVYVQIADHICLLYTSDAADD